ncbi:hypothetical protein CYMTET_45599 [Cymbomonas tetramitiformis]|uniref:Fumarylacetoacetase-like C-terminal domain-containing protein n=1 Tax=Cymbomonas tetramitiformis TaxID=36881 RepID=A0AAE0BXX4_9CHLO|nr:hypothetical protein CYMTET_45599 [Cymbomonas tetramitiformis]
MSGASKLATFVTPSGPRVGLIQGESISPLSGARSMEEVISTYDCKTSLTALQEDAVPLSSVKLLPPIHPARNIICVGKNYLEHVKEVDTHLPGISKEAAPSAPIIFTKAPHSAIGHQEPILYPTGISEQVDYEGELAVVIGKEGRGISRDTALEHVFGYTILNDVTARDLQKKHQQWFLGKSQDTFCPMGPWIVLARDFPLHDGPRIQTLVNGQIRQDDTTSNMIFDVAELIATISAGVSLHPGDIIATGTPAGVGAGLQPPCFLQPGDTVTIRIEGLSDPKHEASKQVPSRFPMGIVRSSETLPPPATKQHTPVHHPLQLEEWVGGKKKGRTEMERCS